VAIAQYQTSTPDVPLTVSARGQEPVVVTLGDEEWELPER
jgi:PHD/YefM family antitoxin component YafN of YafNO toxin-antitoxin module